MEWFPIVSSENGEVIIKGYCERRFIHKTGLKHTTSLIIPVLSYDEGRILTMDKCEKYINEALELKEPAPIAELSVDIFGGHLNYDELTEDEKKENVITQDIMKRNAVKRLEERLLLKSDGDYVNIKVNPSKMKFIGIYECNSEHNNEIGYAYTYPVEIPDGEYIAEITEYTAEGETKKLRLEVLEFLLSELFGMNDSAKSAKSPKYKICDGLSRLLDIGGDLYSVTDIKKPELDKNGHKEPRKFNIFVDIVIPSSSVSAGGRTVKSSEENFFETPRQANERGKQLVKQLSRALNGSSAESSYWVEEVSAK